jgi:hypothetical protein
MEDFNAVVNEIDALIRKNLWFDFTVLSYVGNNLIIAGGLTIHYPSSHSLEILFEDVFYYSGFFREWHSDTKRPVLVLAENAYELNLKHEIEQGYTLFSFVTEDYNNNILIAARAISYKAR